MPELPDVEGFRRILTAPLGGEVVGQVEVLDPSVIRNSSRRRVEATVRNRILVRVDRRGKWLILALGGPALVLHFGMTGSLIATARGTTHDRFDRLALVGPTEVRYRDVRKLGGVWLAEDDATIDDIIGPQGPDARGVSRAELARRLRGRRGAIKPALIDQRVLAGLGNMLSDEVLWRARLTRPAQRRPSARRSMTCCTARSATCCTGRCAREGFLAPRRGCPANEAPSSRSVHDVVIAWTVDRSAGAPP